MFQAFEAMAYQELLCLGKVLERGVILNLIKLVSKKVMVPLFEKPFFIGGIFNVIKSHFTQFIVPNLFQIFECLPRAFQDTAVGSEGVYLSKTPLA